MTLSQILLMTILILSTGIVGILYCSRRGDDKNASTFTVLGTVIGWQNVKLPFMGRSIIQYTKKGKIRQAQSGLTFYRCRPKYGSKRMWTVSAHRMKGKRAIYIAKKAK